MGTVFPSMLKKNGTRYSSNNNLHTKAPTFQ